MPKTLPLMIFFFISLLSCKDNSTTPVIDTPAATQPNIVFIIADDMGWDVFGKYLGNTANKATTPTLDSLSKSGITFTNFWTNPECSPTRAAMLTGRYGFRTSVGGVEAPPVGYLKNSETVIQKYINDKTSNAYSNAVIGKWHVSLTNQITAPESFGVQYFTGFLIGTVPDYYNWTQTSNGIQQTITTYTTTHFVNQSVAWVKQQTKPFFLWLALNAPHTPFHRPPLTLIKNQSLVDNAATINANPTPYYLAAIEAMDKEIARLIGSMTTAQRENTIFVFMGDNGTPSRVAKEPYTTTTAKSTLFQGGINTPLIVCGKGVRRKNEVEIAMIQAPDIFTTFADMAGTGTSTYQDGISFKPLLTNASASKRTYVYSELFTATPTPDDGYALRNDTYKFIHLTNGKEYLYKISTDPSEQTNLLSTTLTAEAQQNFDKLKAIKTGL